MRAALVALFIVAVLAGLTVYHDYQLRPGLFTKKDFQVAKKGTDYITLKWKPVRNADKYEVSYLSYNNEPKTVSVNGDKTEVTLNDLQEGEKYYVSMKVDSEEREGVATEPQNITTKRSQEIKGKAVQMKLSAAENTDLGLTAETPIVYHTEDASVAKVNKDGSLQFNGGGQAVITAEAEETEDYVSDSMEITVDVLDSVNVDTAGATPYIMRTISTEDCELVRKITGANGAIVPQSFGYKDGEYIIAYGMHDKQRIITYDNAEKGVETPGIKLGHPNGFAYSDSTGKCYCVKGWGGRCVTYEPSTGAYDVFTLPYGASGIAYDRDKDMFYTSSRNLMVSYTKDFEVDKTIAAINRGSGYYTQDCGGHGGIMLRCVSDKSKHGTNYVDLYDMVNGKYLGSIACKLSEVESAIVDDEGYMELLCNTTDRTDYIWKTPINIDDLGKDL